MSITREPLCVSLPNHWSPEQAVAVYSLLCELIQLIDNRYAQQIQAWSVGDPPGEQLDLFDDPLPF